MICIVPCVVISETRNGGPKKHRACECNNTAKTCVGVVECQMPINRNFSENKPWPGSPARPGGYARPGGLVIRREICRPASGTAPVSWFMMRGVCWRFCLSPAQWWMAGTGDSRLLEMAGLRGVFEKSLVGGRYKTGRNRNASPLHSSSFPLLPPRSSPFP